VLQSDGAAGLHVLPEGTRVEPAEVVADDEQQVDRTAALERPVDRVHHRAVLVAPDLPGSLEPEDAGRHVRERLDHPPEKLAMSRRLSAAC
jgi:hypothetical protein